MKKLLKLIKSGATAEIFMGLKEAHVLTKFVIGGAEMLDDQRLFFYMVFPEDQHHVHVFKFDKAIEHNFGCFELVGENRLFIAMLESEADKKLFSDWQKYYAEHKNRLDRFIDSERRYHVGIQ